jgi:hypothetical protein
MFTAPVTVVKPFVNYDAFWRWVAEIRDTLPDGSAWYGKSDLFWPYDEHGLDGVAHRATVGIGAAEGLIAEAKAKGDSALATYYGRHLAGWRHVFRKTIEKMGEAH